MRVCNIYDFLFCSLLSLILRICFKLMHHHYLILVKNDFSLDKIYEFNKITRSKEFGKIGCANKI